MKCDVLSKWPMLITIGLGAGILRETMFDIENSEYDANRSARLLRRPPPLRKHFRLL